MKFSNETLFFTYLVLLGIILGSIITTVTLAMLYEISCLWK